MFLVTEYAALITIIRWNVWPLMRGSRNFRQGGGGEGPGVSLTKKALTTVLLYSSIQLYLLLSPYLCFVSFLYLDLYVLGNDASISLVSFMRTKHLCILIHIRIKGEASAVKHVSALKWFFYWPFYGGASFMYLLCFMLIFIYFLVCSLHPCDHLLGKGWPLDSLVCDVVLCFCHFPIWCLGSGMTLDCIDSWYLPSS